MPNHKSRIAMVVLSNPRDNQLPTRAQSAFVGFFDPVRPNLEEHGRGDRKEQQQEGGGDASRE